MRRITLCFVLSLCCIAVGAAERFVSFTGGDWLLTHGGKVNVYVAADSPRGVLAAAENLCLDIHRVSGAEAVIADRPEEASIIVSTKENGRWEEYIINIGDSKINITGSDRRGTIYGIYELSRQIGVSPWYWWADAPIARHDKIYVMKGRYTDGEPAVKYRGIFINDESPSFTGWAHNRFGGVNSQMYARMFELLLRLKANYLWPAMWRNAFNEDDPMSPVLADSLGIVMGTSHHEPMMRAHKEYTKRRSEIGPWDYITNKDNINRFFVDGLQRNKAYDNVVTIGMRGDGDSPMGKGNDDENISTLQDVIAGQRKIISDVYGCDPARVPQLWAIFTEVQRYYDRGLTVPDDVIKLFCDNNWGYIRRTGPAKEQGKPMGLYYHIDMNGGPWNNRWINCEPLPKLREQLNLAYRTGLDDLWIINVGDLKPKELPIDFIMNFAWRPDDFLPQNGDISLQTYTESWARSIFGDAHAKAIAGIVARYAKYNGMRHPENQSTGIYSVENYSEADRMIALWEQLAHDADSVRALLPENAQDAYYQLAYYPAVASATAACIYLYADKNHYYAAQGRLKANEFAEKVAKLYKRDKQLEAYYNNEMADGKWKGMMQDRHFGYTSWWMPKQDSIPVTIRVAPLAESSMGIAVEGCPTAVNLKSAAISDGPTSLPTFDNMTQGTCFVDIFNRGEGSITCGVKVSDSWIRLSMNGRMIASTKLQLQCVDERLHVSIDWEKLKNGTHEGEIIFTSGSEKYSLVVKAEKRVLPQTAQPYYGAFGRREFSIPASGYSHKTASGEAQWVMITDLGRADGDMGIWPVTAPSQTGKNAPHMDYNVYFDEKGSATLLLGIIPTQDINPERGLRIAVGLDDQEPVVLDARQGMLDTFREYTQQNLEKSPKLKALPRANKKIAMIRGNGFCRNGLYDAVRWLDTQLQVSQPGIHTLHIYMVDPEVVVERMIVNPDNHHPSYMGAPENLHQPTLK